MTADRKGPRLDIPEDLAEALDSAPGGEEAADPGDATPAASAAGEEGAEVEIEIEGEPAAPSAEEKLRAELAALQDRHLRMAAEHENQRRRWLREQQDLLNFANENLIKELLPSVDNLERALDHARQAQGEEVEKKNLVEGIELIYRSLMGTLERAGVETIAARGVPFDPRLHEAMRQIPSSEFPPNTVIDVYQRGYALKGRLLRPALVAIAGQAPPPSD